MNTSLKTYLHTINAHLHTHKLTLDYIDNTRSAQWGKRVRARSVHAFKDLFKIYPCYSHVTKQQGPCVYMRLRMECDVKKHRHESLPVSSLASEVFSVQVC